MTDRKATEGPFEFRDATFTTRDGSTLEVLMVEDPPGFMRAATAVETRLRDELNRAQEQREQRCLAHAATAVRDGDCPICDLERVELIAAYWKGAALSGLTDKERASMFEGLSRAIGEEVVDDGE